MRVRIICLTIDATTILIHKVNKICKNQQLAKSILINIKRFFDYISQIKLAQKITDLGINQNFIG